MAGEPVHPVERGEFTFVSNEEARGGSIHVVTGLGIFIVVDKKATKKTKCRLLSDIPRKKKPKKRPQKGTELGPNLDKKNWRTGVSIPVPLRC